MINIATADTSTLQVEILFNEEIYNRLEKEHGSTEDFLEACSDDDMREILTDWIIENNEATC